jgi:hypothetical protein
LVIRKVDGGTEIMGAWNVDLDVTVFFPMKVRSVIFTKPEFEIRDAGIIGVCSDR